METWQILTFTGAIIMQTGAIVYFVTTKFGDSRRKHELLNQKVEEMQKWKDKHECENADSIDKLAIKIEQGFEKTNGHIMRLNLLLAKNMNIEISDIINT